MALYHVGKPTAASGTIDIYDVQTLAHTGTLSLSGSSVYTSVAFLDGALYVTTSGGEIVPINLTTGAAGAPLVPTGGPVSIQKITGAADRHCLLGVDAARHVVEIDPLTLSLSVLPVTSLAAAPQSISYANGRLFYNQSTFSNRYDLVDLASGTDTPLTFSDSSVISFGGDGALMPPPVEYYRVYRDGVMVSSSYLGTSTFTDASLLDGTYVYTASAIDVEGNESPASDPVTVTIDTAAPAVSSLRFGDGSVQRSMVKTLTVTFSERIDLSSGALTVQNRRGGALAGINVDVAPSGDGRTFVITFSGTGVTGDSLPDGLYRVFASAAGIHDQAGNPLTGNYSYQFHRLFGDADGDRDEDALDLARFHRALSRPSLYNEMFDYNGDSKINLVDYLQLKNRLNRAKLP
jgi:hypothetical protein